MFVAAVYEVALRFVCTPTGIRPKTAIKQNAATPSARVTSTSENAAILQLRCLMAGKRAPHRLSYQAVSPRDFLRPDRAGPAERLFHVSVSDRFPSRGQLNPRLSKSRSVQYLSDRSILLHQIGIDRRGRGSMGI